MASCKTSLDIILLVSQGKLIFLWMRNLPSLPPLSLIDSLLLVWLWSYQLSLLQPLDEPGADGPDTAAVTATGQAPLHH